MVQNYLVIKNSDTITLRNKYYKKTRLTSFENIK